MKSRHMDVYGSPSAYGSWGVDLIMLWLLKRGTNEPNWVHLVTSSGWALSMNPPTSAPTNDTPDRLMLQHMGIAISRCSHQLELSPVQTQAWR